MDKLGQKEIEQLIADHIDTLAWVPRLPSKTGYTEKVAQYLPFSDSQNISSKPPATTLGTLEVLPTEVLGMIFLNSDINIDSLFVLRHVSDRARLLVDSLLATKAITRHAPDVRRAFILSGAGLRVSCERLFEVLTNPVCARCPDYGCYIYLPTCQRVCGRCTVTEEFLPLTIPQAKKWYTLNNQDLEKLPRTLSCPYTPIHHISRRARLPLLSTPDVLEVARERHGWSREEATRRATKSQHRYQGYSLMHGAWLYMQTSALGQLSDLMDRQYSLPLWSFATVPALWIDMKNGVSEWGISCSCQMDDMMRRDSCGGAVPYRMFTKAMFIKHARECPSALQGLEKVLAERDVERKSPSNN